MKRVQNGVHVHVENIRNSWILLVNSVSLGVHEEAIKQLFEARRQLGSIWNRSGVEPPTR